MTHSPTISDEEGLGSAEFRRELAALYDDLDAEVRRAGPVCDLSGLCCRFQEYDHTLFLSAPEAEVLIAEAPAPSRPMDDGATCPWQDLRGRCTARDARPLGCRVYFCDPSYAEEGPRIAESFIGRLKSLVERAGLPWDYAPLHRHLDDAVQAGRLVAPRAHEDGEISASDPR